jgi:hypothetical protein
LGFFQLITSLVELAYARIPAVSRMAVRKIALRMLTANLFPPGKIETVRKGAEWREIFLEVRIRLSHFAPLYRHIDDGI